jgi:hypothetical protein
MAAAKRIGARAIFLGREELAGVEHARSLLEAAGLLCDQDAVAARARASAKSSGVPTSITGSGSA